MYVSIRKITWSRAGQKIENQSDIAVVIMALIHVGYSLQKTLCWCVIFVFPHVPKHSDDGG
jgi:hypothetical protein